MMRQSTMLGLTFWAVLMISAGSASAAAVLFGGQTVTVAETLADPTDLWVAPDDLTRINGFVLKSEGACLDDICIPVPRGDDNNMVVSRDGKTWFNVTELARKLGQAYASDAQAGVWSFAEIPAVRGAELQSAVAPDFALKDRTGKVVHLSDFRGKKVLLNTWASWCGCRTDLPGWQAIYSELEGQGFEIISAAQDAGGEAAAGPWFDRSKATFTQIVDENHTISALYNMVNVPTGVWINEEGIIVRPPETAYSSNVELKLGAKTLSSNGADYVAALRDWVEKGSASAFAMAPDQVTAKMAPRTADQARAEALFQLGVYFNRAGDSERANRYWEQAEQLRPESWNYHRQDWSFTPAEAGPNWMKKFQGLGDKEYYPKLDLPPAGEQN